MLPLPPPSEAPCGIYLHVPFCGTRCSYCDFATVTGADARVPAYVEALGREIAVGQPELPKEADTVYFGGGTPSRLPPAAVGCLLGAVARRFDLGPAPEVTLEANPETLDRARIAGYRAAGVTRLSVGVQSLDDAVLRRVGRAHGAATALAAVRAVRATGGLAVSVDLIVGLPGEALERWPTTVERVVALEPDHVSMYVLESDKETPLGRGVRSGRVALDDDEAQAEAWDAGIGVLAAAGYRRYEIANFARPGAPSRHNLKYWSDVPYGGFGVGAHGYAAGARRGNRRDLEGYLADVADGRDPGTWHDAWDPVRRLEEALVLGLRRDVGVDLERLGARYGFDLRARYGEVWQRACDLGLAAWSGTAVVLTELGRRHANEVFSELLSAPAESVS